MKAIVSVLGHDSIGLIAKVCTFLSEQEINITDISQNIVGGYINMTMLVELSQGGEMFERVSDELSELGQSMGLAIKVQREDIFTAMHRV